MNEKNIVIIGGGQAASQVATSLRQKNFMGDISILSSEGYLPYQRPPLSKKYLSGELDSERLYLKPEKFYQDQNINVMLNSYVEEIDRGNSKLTFSKNNGEEDTISYDNLVISTGTSPRLIPLDNPDLKGVHYLRSIEDVEGIKKSLIGAKNMVIIGGGYIGLEVAAVSRKLGLSVTVVEMASRILERVTSPVISSFYHSYHESQGVEIMTSTSVNGINGDINVSSVETSSGIIEADIVVVGIGVLPCQNLAEKAGIETNNGIVVNEFCISSDSNVFSAGDCTLHPSAFYKRDIRLESVHNAIEQGKTVASSIMEEFVPYNQIPWFWSDQYDLKFQIAGLNNDYDEYIVRGRPEDNSFSVFYFKDGFMISSDCVNSAPEHMMSRRFIFNRAEVDLEKLQNKEISIKEVI
ncbi:MAG: NAD(P)/FAD-dependent oxidoreductase [Alphaproteobacteria bacterium]|nr:NAD(P)/FAD-dependent oxidoreductase [Alphaproteobacteria bacterium]